MEIFPSFMSWTSLLVNISIFLVLIVAYVQWFLSKKYSYFKRKGLDGPPVIPFVGNMITFSKPQPLVQVENQKKYGNLFGMFQGTAPMLSISDPLIIKRILVQDFHMFRNRANQVSPDEILAHNLFSTRGEKWKRIRSILTPMFTTSKLKKMEGIMNQCVDAMMKALAKHADTGEEFLPRKVMGNFTMDVIAKCAFATNTNAHNEIENPFVRNAKSLFEFSMLKAFALFAFTERMQKMLWKMRFPLVYTKENVFFTDLSFHLIKQRKNDADCQIKDMLQLMIEATHGTEATFEEEDKFDAHHVNVGEEELYQEEKEFKEIIGSKYLSEDEIAAQAVLFFLAGYETTATTLTFTFHQLATHPEIQEKLYQEIKSVLDKGEKLDYNNVMKLPYLDAVIAETLRYRPPVSILIREVCDDYHIPEYKYTMQKGEGVVIPIYAIHHNPEFYKNPEKYDPERFMPENRDSLVPYTYLPFGGGPRNCIGMRFALTEAKLGLARILSEFKITKSDKSSDVKIEKSLFIMKTTPIYVKLERRNKSN